MKKESQAMDKETQTERLDSSQQDNASNDDSRTSENNTQICRAQQNNKTEPGDSQDDDPLNCKATQTETYGDENGLQESEKKHVKQVLKEVGLIAAKAALISGGVLGGIALAVPAIGFGAGGVAAGSLAAFYQSTFLGGTIVSGSAFAVLQSVGAAGLAASTNAAVIAGSFAATGIQSVVSKVIKSKKKTRTGEDDAHGSDSPSGDSNTDNQNGSADKKKTGSFQSRSRSDQKDQAENNERKGIKIQYKKNDDNIKFFESL